MVSASRIKGIVHSMYVSGFSCTLFASISVISVVLSAYRVPRCLYTVDFSFKMYKTRIAICSINDNAYYLFQVPFIFAVLGLRKVDVIKTMNFKDGGRTVEILLLESDYSQMSQDTVFLFNNDKYGSETIAFSEFSIKQEFPACIKSQHGTQSQGKHILVCGI